MIWFQAWSDTNQAVQPQKMTRGGKSLCFKVVENKGADLLCVNHEADLRGCFSRYAALFFV